MGAPPETSAERPFCFRNHSGRRSRHPDSPVTRSAVRAALVSEIRPLSRNAPFGRAGQNFAKRSAPGAYGGIQPARARVPQLLSRATLGRTKSRPLFALTSKSESSQRFSAAGGGEAASDGEGVVATFFLMRYQRVIASKREINFACQFLRKRGLKYRVRSQAMRRTVYWPIASPLRRDRGWSRASHWSGKKSDDRRARPDRAATPVGKSLRARLRGIPRSCVGSSRSRPGSTRSRSK